ncbi:LysM domain-containing protein [Leifsonia poae]|uniref:LysM domain-containing protein n=1 Tax=Leifsonia poae TaxID=110933 RepID=UPI001CC0FABC|nr:LysM domain-containing protein [Leifsonia poae]
MGHWGDVRRAGTSAGAPSKRRILPAAVLTVAVAAALAGCSLFAGSTDPTPTPKHTEHATSTPSSTPLAGSTGDVVASASPTPPPVPPTLTAVPKGTVVAQGDVASPKGSIHFHYRMVANGDNTYSAEYSSFTSTVPVPISVTLIDIPPSVGDGLTYHGVGDHLLGGPTTRTAPATSALLSVGQPSYLGTLVTYSSVASADGVPVELGPNKVLAVTTVRWSVPVRQSNVHPVDGGTRTYAAGTVTATTASGAPKRYLVASGTPRPSSPNGSESPFPTCSG